MSETPEHVDVVALIGEWAELQFTPEQIATGLDLDPEEALARMDDPLDAWGKAYAVGQLRGEATVRQAVYTGAKQGSTASQKQFEEYVADRKRRDGTT